MSGPVPDVPDRGHLVWISLDPQSGHEQAGRRPALVVSPASYNGLVGLALFCPVTGQAKGYPFEVPLPPGLAVSGVVLQALLRNPVADPYLLGISAGASTGAVSVALLGLGAGMLSLSMGAFLGAVAAFALVALLARAAGGGAISGSAQIILAGIAGSQLFNALTSFLITKSASAEQARGIMFWLLGNLSGVDWQDVLLAVPMALAGVLLVAWHTRALDAFTFGAESAASLGVPVRRVQATLIACTALVTAVMVSIVGSIGFVGLVIPHAARLLVGARHGRLVPVSALIGAVFLIAADVLSRTAIKGQVLPIGVVTALVGAPAFAVILVRGRRGR